MRIALVSETYFPQINGVSRTLSQLVAFLAGQGDEIRLYLPRYRSAPVLPPTVSAQGFAAMPVPFYPEVLLPMVRPAVLRKDFAAFRPDLVHIATEGPLGWAALRAARQLGLPVVSSYHSNFSQYLRLYGLGWLAGGCWRYLRWFHNATRATFCPALSTLEDLQGRGFKRLHLWGRGVDSQRFDPPWRDREMRRAWGAGEDTLVLLHVGRLAVEKNVTMLLDAFIRLAGDNVRLVLVGDGPLRPLLEANADQRVIFAGYRQGEELARFYASADLFAFPSLTDTFGNVLLEAMASGLPAVGFRVPGPQDVIRDDTGLLVNEVGAAPLAAALTGLLSDPRHRRQLSSQARAHAETLTWKVIMGGLRAEYLRVLTEGVVSSKSHFQKTGGR
jgi:glycosyltransferase involved in cell wall biosynthesis